MKKKSSGKIENVSIGAEYDVPIDGPILLSESSSILAGYDGSSLTTYINAGGNIFLPTDLSNVDPLYYMVSNIPLLRGVILFLIQFKPLQISPFFY